METLLQDIRYGSRMLLKHKGFTAIAVIIVALGIGANTAIFSLVNAVLLRPLPFPHAEEIVYFEGSNASQGISDSNVSAPDLADWSNQTSAFAETAAFATGGSILAGGNAEPERVPKAAVSASFFSVLGVQPVLGRSFVAKEDRAGGDLVAVLSHGLWQRRFGGDKNILGSKITISGRSMTVVGVMPTGFDFPEKSQLWTSLRLDPAEERRDNRAYSALARLKSAVTLQQAQSQISTINAQLAAQFKDTNAGWDAHVVRLHDRLVRDVRPSLLALLGAVTFVLLIACANVANLLLARAASRQKEMALGASRLRVIRQMLTESVLLALLGGTLGLILSVWLTDLLVSITPPEAPQLDRTHLDYGVLVFAAAISALTGLFFGLAPALQASRTDVSGSLKAGARGSSSHGTNRARSLLLISEVALSLMLLVGAGLLTQSFLRLRDVKPGFNPAHVLTMSLSLPYAKYSTNQQRIAFFQQLIDRVKTLPAVESAGAALSVPLDGSGYAVGRAFIPEGRALAAEESLNASYSTATPDYFRTMQIPLVAGRGFSERDTEKSPMVVVINQTLAQHSFGSAAAAIGKRITIWRDEKFPREIVGIVGDTKPSTLEAASPAQIYVPQTQDANWGFMTLAVRANGDPAAMTSAVRHEVLAIDKDQPIYNVQTMDDVVAKSVGSRRVSMLLFSVSAGVALLLAAVGIYGVIAFAVSQRTQEIGIRMALGAQAADVMKLVLSHGMALTLIGIGVGVIGAFALSRLLESLLFGVGASDPATFAGVSLLLMVVALAACFIPARRAARLNPVKALSWE